MNRNRILHFGLRKGALSIVVSLLAFGLFQETAQAKRVRIVLPDGVEAVFDITEQEATPYG